MLRPTHDVVAFILSLSALTTYQPRFLAPRMLRGLDDLYGRLKQRGIILPLDSCAWACACTLSLVAPHVRGMASRYQTELDVDVPLLAVV